MRVAIYAHVERSGVPPGQHLRLNVAVANLLNSDWNEAQFDTESHLPGEAVSVSELHFTPGSPRNLRAGLTLFF